MISSPNQPLLQEVPSFNTGVVLGERVWCVNDLVACGVAHPSHNYNYSLYPLSVFVRDNEMTFAEDRVCRTLIRFITAIERLSMSLPNQKFLPNQVGWSYQFWLSV